MSFISFIKLSSVDLFRKTTSLVEYKNLIKSQWYPYSEIEKMQIKKLRLLIQHCYENVPYYRNLFKEYNINPKNIDSIHSLEALPTLNKDIIRKSKDLLLPKNKEEYSPVKKSTGGSTGSPLEYYVSKKAQSVMWGNIWRAWNTIGYNPGDKIAVLAGSSLLSGFDFKKNLYYYLMNWAPMSSFILDSKHMEKYLRKIRNDDIQFLYSYASAAYELARYVIENNIKGIKLKGVICTAEVLLPHYRETIQKAFNCKVLNQYGANDGGITAFECEFSNGLHISSERCIVEILNEDGTRAKPNEEGKIVLTDLDNWAMPFIRYEVGDIGSITFEKCQCGRELPLIKTLKGRERDFIITASGNKIHGSFFTHLLRHDELIKQYQVVQKEKGKINILLNVSRTPEDQEIKYYESKLKRELPDIEVNIVLENKKLTSTKGGKHKFIINEIE